MQPRLETWKSEYNLELVIVSNEPSRSLDAFIKETGLQAVYLDDDKSLVTRKYTASAFIYDCGVDENGRISLDLSQWKGDRSLADIEAWLKEK